MELNVTVKKIIYTGNDGWICAVAKTDKGTRISLTGKIDVRAGCDYLVTGEYTNHPRYGLGFNCMYVEPVKPTDLDGLVSYLSSGFIKGIGPITAQRIVEKFGWNTLNTIENEPERLLSIKGISKRILKKITESYGLSNKYKSLCRLLMPFNITEGAIKKIVDAYGDKAYEKVMENPYALMEDIEGFGFKKVDEIAYKLGFKHDCPERLRAAILYFLSYDCEKEGNVYVLKVTLTKKINELLNEKIDYKNELEKLVNEGIVVVEDNRVYAAYLYNAERFVASALNKHRNKKDINAKNILERISKSIKNENPDFIGFNSEQEEAITNACKYNLSVITGGPGTGKTFTLKGILKALEITNPGENITLMAPTGKAAKRMTEQTGRLAFTIHKVVLSEDNNIDIAIIDESSMINLLLMAKLLHKLHSSCKLIFIGDIDQLPCIGPGTVLKDLIANYEATYLKSIYRQDTASAIVKNASLIKLGDDKILEDKTFKFKYVNDNSEVMTEILRQYEKYKNMYGSKEVIVLCPYKQKSEICSNTINEKLSKHSYLTFKIGDRVIHTENDYNLQYYEDINSDNPSGSGVFNGETGTIVDIDEIEITVELDDGRIVYYEKKIAKEELSLCYAMTIHKSQGSEYKVVIMPIIKSHAYMLKRNLLYTGITRAREKCILIGSKDAYDFAVRTNDIKDRKSYLGELLKIQNLKDKEIVDTGEVPF